VLTVPNFAKFAVTAHAPAAKLRITSNTVFTAREAAARTAFRYVNSVTLKSARSVAHHAQIARKRFVRNAVKNVATVRNYFAPLVKRHS
jgi:hypothetical protein